MSASTQTLHGVIKDGTVVFASSPDLPNGTEVVVTVPLPQQPPLKNKDKLLAAAGCCPEWDVEAFNEEVRRLRHMGHPRPDPFE